MRWLAGCALALVMLCLAGCGAGEPPPETVSTGYEFTISYAKTPTHIFAARGGALYRMPLKDIARQEKIPLPKQFDELAFSGLTEKWLYVSGGTKSSDEEYNLQGSVTYRISLETLNVEKIDESNSKTDWYPRYNAASDSLLYIQGHTVEAFDLGTSKRGMVFDFKKYLGASGTKSWMNTPDGKVVLDILLDWWDGGDNCLVFDENNKVQVMSDDDFPWGWQLQTPQQPLNKAEEALEKRTWDHKENPRNYESDEPEYIYVDEYVTCGDYVYYVEAGWTNENHLDHFYRVKTDGTEKTLLRAGANIRSLMAVNKKLFCLAPRADNSEELGFYALDENGNVIKAISYGYDGEWSWVNFMRFGDLIMFYEGLNGHRETRLITLYDPATGAVFSTEGEPAS